jgi:hypothetical protein
MAANWNRRFGEPIKLPGGGKLFTLKHAIAWLAKEIPQSEHRLKEVQTAAHCVTEAAENGGRCCSPGSACCRRSTGIGTKPTDDGYKPGFCKRH